MEAMVAEGAPIRWRRGLHGGMKDHQRSLKHLLEFLVWWIWGQYIPKGALVIFDGLNKELSSSLMMAYGGDEFVHPDNVVPVYLTRYLEGSALTC
ncbi:hypothetical protein MTR_4g013145 [Medicago truncatula]|uniref:Uncharacterized protein n=1 Tax=Medicago truncatula TaxID=3880 RepID=A0A072USE5_MEDTR|nr:hypothetical protein MTR_4g013145 [Medicago truncatula]